MLKSRSSPTKQTILREFKILSTKKSLLLFIRLHFPKNFHTVLNFSSVTCCQTQTIFHSYSVAYSQPDTKVN